MYLCGSSASQNSHWHWFIEIDGCLFILVTVVRELLFFVACSIILVVSVKQASVVFVEVRHCSLLLLWEVTKVGNHGRATTTVGIFKKSHLLVGDLKLGNVIIGHCSHWAPTMGIQGI